MNLNKLVILGSLLASFSAQALNVVGAKLDATKENIIVSVSHGGGCGESSYELVLEGCAESFPAQCQAKIKHMTNDFCEAMLMTDVVFNLKKYKLTDKYYHNAFLLIKGDQGTKAAITLPGPKAASSVSGSSTTAKNGVRCSTHTGSDLVITDMKVTLITTDNKVSEFKIVDTQMRLLESMPSILQMTYKLDDGRSLKTHFTSGSNKGTGKFIRLDGSYSPEFNCTK